MEHPWESLSLTEVADRLAPHDVDWWVAGGQAIDLFLGWESRPHADVDIELFRRDREVLFDAFAGWELFAVSEGRHVALERGVDIADGVFGIWGRPSSRDPWAVEVILASGEGGLWRYRRDPSISLRREALTLRSGDGMQFCTPEVQLLYKAKQSREKDDVDLVRTLHLLTVDQRSWLRDAIEATMPGHVWGQVLRHSVRER